MKTVFENQEPAVTPFASALAAAGIKPRQYCRAVERLSSLSFSPTMVSRWLSGDHAASPTAVALAVLLGQLSEEARAPLIAPPPRKPYTRKEAPEVKGKDE